MESSRCSSFTRSQSTINLPLLSGKTVLTCTKCSNEFPKLISTVHNSIASIALECPCGNSEIIPIEQYLSEMNLNISPSKIVDKCYSCRETKEMGFCVHCSKFLCAECGNEKTHSFARNEYIIRSLCKQHKSIRAYYCYSCEKEMCDMCLLDHRDHDYTSLKEVYDHLNIAVDIEQFHESINNIMKSKEQAKDVFIKVIDDYIVKLNHHKNIIENTYTKSKIQDQSLHELISLLYSNFESTSQVPNYTIMKNLEINSNLNFSSFAPNDSNNISQYCRELKEYFDSNFIINSNVSKILHKTQSIEEFFVNDLILINSNTFATISLREVKLWNSMTFQHLTTYKDHSKPITNASRVIFNQKQVLCTCSLDKTIKIWDVDPPYNCLLVLTGHKNGVTSIAQLKESKKLLSIGEDGTLMIWNLEKGKMSKNYHIEKGIHFLTEVDGNRIAVDSRNIIKVYNVNSVHKNSFLIGHTDEVSSLISLPNSKIASGAKDMTIKIWNVDDQFCELTFKAHSSAVVKLLMYDLSTLISASSNGEINIWDLTYKKRLSIINRKNISAITMLNIDNFCLVSCSGESMDFWKIENRKRNKNDDEYILFD